MTGVCAGTAAGEGGVKGAATSLSAGSTLGDRIGDIAGDTTGDSGMDAMAALRAACAITADSSAADQGMLRAAAAWWMAAEVNDGNLGDDDAEAFDSTGETGISLATFRDGKPNGNSKSEGSTTDPKDSNPSTGESSKAENGLDVMDESSPERLSDKSAASHSSNPLPELTEGANKSLELLSMPEEEFLPSWARADSKASADFTSFALVVSNMAKSTAMTIAERRLAWTAGGMGDSSDKFKESLGQRET